MISATDYVNPLIVQRADPYIYKHTDGYYYFTASVLAYNLIEIRRAKTLNGLAHAAPRTIWRKHPDGSGPMSQLIWPPNYITSMENGSFTLPLPILKNSTTTACFNTGCIV